MDQKSYNTGTDYALYWMIAVFGAVLLLGLPMRLKSSLALVAVLVPLFSVFVLVTARSAVRAAPIAFDLAQIEKSSEEWGDWPMAGANPQRTSWNSEEIRGHLRPVWYKSFEPYISQKVQIIAALDMLFVSTAAGLYALDAETGAEQWVYATTLPLGHSPTIDTDRKIAYVGGFDHKLHAIDALTGKGLWTFEAQAGFHTNPLVVDGRVYAGNRDGRFYAIHTEGAQAGMLAWSYQTDGPILFSAAYADGVVYFASNDSHAYALNAASGNLIWRSPKLPGAGFHSWWPVVNGSEIVFAGSNNYRAILPGVGLPFTVAELQDVYPNYASDPRGTFIGPVTPGGAGWPPGTTLIGANRIFDYFAEKPWRRTVFVLDRLTGQESLMAPVLWTGTHSGTRYPPLVGTGNVLYQQNNYMSDPWIAGGHVSGWQPGEPAISQITRHWNAVDEPMAYSAGGNLIYWNNCCDREMGAIDVSIPLDSTLTREWRYFSYDLNELAPGYNERYYHWHEDYTYPGAVFGGPNGLYSNHGDNNPPIPYQGKVYVHLSNAVIAFDASGKAPTKLPTTETVTVPGIGSAIRPRTTTELRAELESEIQGILTAGHMRPAYYSHGLFDDASKHKCGDNLIDYGHNTAELIHTLAMAWPHLSQGLQDEVKDYLILEMTSFPPYKYNHTGWSGVAREVFEMPPDAQIGAYLAPVERNYSFLNFGGWNSEGVWGRNPSTWYALWEYASVFGGAVSLLSASQGAFWEEFGQQPSDELLKNMPSVHNAYIAGYLGFLKLQELAGQPPSTQVDAELDRLLALRAQHFGSNDSSTGYCRTLNAAQDYMYMVPELAEYLKTTVLEQAAAAVAEDEYYAPYWFVAFAEEGYSENAINFLYDSYGLFLAKAWILDAYQQTLQQYLDVPAFPHGDLLYIQKLVATIEAEVAPLFFLEVEPTRQVVAPGRPAEYIVTLVSMGDFDEAVTLTIDVPSGIDFWLSQNPVVPTQPQAMLTIVSDIVGDSHITITATSSDLVQTATVVLLSRYTQQLPLIAR